MIAKRITVPDYLSLYRILAAPFLWYAISTDKKKSFIVLCAISLFTDAADGFTARHLRQETRHGAVLDSAGDFVTIVLMALALLRFKKRIVHRNKWVFNGLLLLYILQAVLAYWKYKKATSFHTYSSKLAFSFIGGFYLLLFTVKEIKWLFRLSSALLAIALIEDIVLVFLLSRPKENVKGIYWVIKK